MQKLVVCTCNMTVASLQGYRDASCLFVEMLVNKNMGASSSAYHGNVKSDYCLCLAIHAPRKGIVEVCNSANCFSYYLMSFQFLFKFLIRMRVVTHICKPHVYGLNGVVLLQT